MTETTQTREKRNMGGIRREATQCPIFLLQISQIGFTADFNHADWEYLDDGVMRYRETGEEYSDSAVDRFLLERGMARRYWTTFGGGVWFTREEAEAEAERRSYHYGEKGKDWRVFCVCAFGRLREIMDEHTDYEAGKP